MKTKYRNTAFLVELIVNILVFSISCAVLVGLFGRATEISRSTEEKSRAATELQYLVESVKAGGLSAVAFETETEGPAETATLYYYAPFGEGEPSDLPAPGSFLRYTVQLSVTTEDTGGGTLSHIDAAAYASGGGEIYSLSTAHYNPKETL